MSSGEIELIKNDRTQGRQTICMLCEMFLTIM